MPFDFPAGPNPGDVFTDPISGASFTWNGYAWMGGAANSLGALIVSDTPPAAPANNSLWFESDSGMLFLRYNDGNSSQWVQLNALPNGAGYMPLQGVSDGSNAPAGQIGEVISSLVTANVSLTTAVNTNITSIVLSAGDWDVTGQVFITVTATATSAHSGLGPTSAVITVVPSLVSAVNGMNTTFAAGPIFLPLRPARVNVTAPTTYYLVGFAVFASGTATATGDIIARRVR